MAGTTSSLRSAGSLSTASLSSAGPPTADAVTAASAAFAGTLRAAGLSSSGPLTVSQRFALDNSVTRTVGVVGGLVANAASLTGLLRAANAAVTDHPPCRRPPPATRRPPPATTNTNTNTNATTADHLP